MKYKLKNTYRTTDNAGLYNKIKKRYLESKSRIFCSYCPYHKGENFTKCWSQRSWKDTTKARKQWERHF